jgi:hypothetical protein
MTPLRNRVRYQQAASALDKLIDTTVSMGDGEAGPVPRLVGKPTTSNLRERLVIVDCTPTAREHTR